MRMKGMRRGAASATPTGLVSTGTIDGQGLPLVITPAVEGVDLRSWAADNRELIGRYLLQHGAVLFRGFGLRTVADFEAVASAITPELFGEYGDLPRLPDSERIYGSTPYPADKTILFHNESSHLPRWPMKQFFFCVIAAQTGGETPIIDCRQLCRVIDPDVLSAFEEKGLLYVRNFSKGFDVSWQDFFKSDDRDEVEEICRTSGMGWEWRSGDRLMITQSAPAISVHPVTGDRVFFNQVQLHHVSCLDQATLTSLRELFDEPDLPRNVSYGDGSPIEDETMAYLGKVFDDNAVALPWQEGDIYMLDNMLVSHGRRPFGGPRKIAVAMAEMVESQGQGQVPSDAAV
jgi:alpha-ketoglutarate-dependent taurine dioxygenase